MKNRFAGGALAASIAASSVLMPFTSTSHAADGKVQYKDIRAEQADYVEIAPHAASGKGRIALLIKGGDDALLKALWNAAHLVEQETDKDVWFLHANDDKRNDGKTEVAIYISGGQTGTLNVAGLPTNKLLGDAVIAVVQDGIRWVGDTPSLTNLPTPENES